MKTYQIIPKDSNYIYYTFAESVYEAKEKFEKHITETISKNGGRWSDNGGRWSDSEDLRQKFISNEIKGAVIQEHDFEVIEIWMN